ncbi:MAG: protein kinase [Myxococcaceae bacterium]|nr:protein kinase [Myxococcaceae bacterium]
MSADSPLDATSVRDPLLGAKLGDYQVLGPLGEGGMGVVYEGLHTVINKRVAIKVIKPEFSGDQVLVRRVLAEAQAVNAVRHRGIVDIHAHGLTPDGRPYLVMELLHGETLHDLLARQGQLSQTEAIGLLLEATGPLFAAHKAGIVHRDLKPSNLFLCRDDDGERFLKLLDFGLAKRTAPGVSSSTMTSASLIVGTPDYMAPEQARAQPTDARTDIYALGVLAFELLAGRLPFTAGSSVDLVMQHLSAPVPRLVDLDPSIPQELSDLVAQMMAKEPPQRPQSLEPVRALLRQLSGRSAASPSAPRPSQVRPSPVTPAVFEPTFVRPSQKAPREATEPELPLVPTVDRTVVAMTPEATANDVGTADTAMSLQQVAPKPSGKRREPVKAAEPAVMETVRHGASTTAVVKRAVQREAQVTVSPEDSTPPAPREGSKLPLLVVGGLLVIIIGGGVFVMAGRTSTETVDAQPVVDGKPSPKPVEEPKPAAVEPLPQVVVPPEVPPTVEVKPVVPAPTVATKPDKKPHSATVRPTTPRRVPSQEELTARVEKLRGRLTDSSKRLILEKRLAPKLKQPMSDDERQAFSERLNELER